MIGTLRDALLERHPVYKIINKIALKHRDLNAEIQYETQSSTDIVEENLLFHFLIPI